MEWIQHLDKANPPTIPPKMIFMIQSSDLKWEIAKRQRKCIIAKMKIICKKDICLTVTHKHSASYKKSMSLGRWSCDPHSRNGKQMAKKKYSVNRATFKRTLTFVFG